MEFLWYKHPLEYKWVLREDCKIHLDARLVLLGTWGSEKSFEPLHWASSKDLTLKTLFLLSAASACRVSELHELCIDPPFLIQNPWISSSLSHCPGHSCHLQMYERLLVNSSHGPFVTTYGKLFHHSLSSSHASYLTQRCVGCPALCYYTIGYIIKAIAEV